MIAKLTKERSVRGFTLIELLVVVAIIALLISILLPSLSRARDTARQVQCASILKQIGTADQFYRGDFDNWCIPGRVNNLAWLQNPAFRRYMGVETTAGWGRWLPEGLVCPEATFALEDPTLNTWAQGANIAWVYGMNTSQIPPSGMQPSSLPTTSRPT